MKLYSSQIVTNYQLLSFQNITLSNITNSCHNHQHHHHYHLIIVLVICMIVSSSQWSNTSWSKLLQSVAREYFSSSNFLNHRILTDIAAVEKSYDDKWEGMQEKEKEKVFFFLIKSNSIHIWEFIEKISVCELEKSGGFHWCIINNFIPRWTSREVCMLWHVVSSCLNYMSCTSNVSWAEWKIPEVALGIVESSCQS